MGADAVAIASAALIAAACQQYRICGTGKCPVGIATQDPELRARLNVDAAAQRVANFLNVSLAELKTFARVTGNRSAHGLNRDDLGLMPVLALDDLGVLSPTSILCCLN